jgi:hypothetical protein
LTIEDWRFTDWRLGIADLDWGLPIDRLLEIVGIVDWRLGDWRLDRSIAPHEQSAVQFINRHSVNQQS